MDIDVYQQYFAAEGSFSGVRRRGAAVMLTASSGGGEICYTLTVSFFPHKDAEDFGISYDAAYSIRARAGAPKNGSRAFWKRSGKRPMRSLRQNMPKYSGISR